jgi:hypothetical protein
MKKVLLSANSALESYLGAIMMFVGGQTSTCSDPLTGR